MTKQIAMAHFYKIQICNKILCYYYEEASLDQSCYFSSTTKIDMQANNILEFFRVLNLLLQKNYSHEKV